MTKMAWTKRVKMVDVEYVEKSMREVAQSWDEIGNATGAYVVMEIAEKIGLPPDTVLTDKQVKELKKRGVL